MTALVVNLDRVRHAVWLSSFMGMPESRQTVVNRQVADARDVQGMPRQPQCARHAPTADAALRARHSP